jgi:TM2 domain-containing membrane protein YozV
MLGGVFGLHRFYVGRTQSGVIMALTLGGLGMWWLYDMVILVSGEFRDDDDLPLRNWQVRAVRCEESAAGRRD